MIPEYLRNSNGDLGLSGNGIRGLNEKLGTNLAENLFNKGDGGGTGSQLVKNVADLVGKFTNKDKVDVDAINDVKRTLSANRPNQKGEIKISDSQLKEAFSDYQNFLNKYKKKLQDIAFYLTAIYTYGDRSFRRLYLKLPTPSNLIAGWE